MSVSFFSNRTRCAVTCLSGLLLVLSPDVQAGPVVDVRSTPLGTGDRFLFPLGTDVVLDGDLREVRDREPTLVLTRTGMQRFGRVDGQVDGDADASVDIWMAWTEESLYVAARIRDDRLVGGEGGQDWSRLHIFATDTLFVSFLSGLRADQARYQESPLAMTYYAEGGTPRPQKNPADYVAVRTADGYTLEGIMPLSSLGWRPGEGDWLNFYVILVDQDGLTPDGKRDFGQLLYVEDPRPRLRLAAAGSAWAGDLRTDSPVLTAGDQLYLTATVDALQPGGTLREIRVLDGEGRQVYRQPLDTSLPAGQTTRVLFDLSAAQLGPGRYEARLSFGPDDRSARQAATGFTLADTGKAAAAPPKVLASLRYMRYILPQDPPPYSPMTVTTEDYWDLVRELWPHYFFGVSLEEPEKLPLRHNTVHTSMYNIPLVLMYKLTGKQQYLSVAMENLRLLDEDVRAGKVIAEQYSSLALAEMYHLLEDDPNFPPEQAQRWRELIVREAQDTWANEAHQGGFFEYGNNNRGFWYLFRYAVALAINPGVPEAAVWKPYVDEMWPYYLNIKDVDENTTGYGIGDPKEVLHFVRVMGYHDEYFADPEARYFHGRFARELSPFGDLPIYGDGAGYGASLRLIPQFEHMAGITRDGRYKWAAHRAFEYFRRFKLDEIDYVDAVNFLHDMLWALYFRDESVTEVAPEWGSELLTRKRYTRGDWGRKFYWFMDENVSMPHKMVLRSGFGADDLFAMVECAPDGGHAPAMPGALFYLARDRSLLLNANVYQNRRRQNVVYLSDREGLADRVPEEVSVPYFSEHAHATAGVIEIDGYQELPVAKQRSLLFLKNRFVVVKDRLRFEAGGLYDVFCHWHTKDVGLDTGSHWANTCIPAIENWAHIPAQYRTYDRDLLIWFTPQDRHRLEIANHQNLRLDLFAPTSVSQKWSGRVRGGDRLHFTTVLWPHRPVRQTDTLLTNFKVLEDSLNRTVLEIAYLDRDGAGRTRSYPNLVMFNETGEMLDLAFEGQPVRTDARYLVLQQMKQAPGLSVTALQATSFSHAGQEHFSSAERADFDQRL